MSVLSGCHAARNMITIEEAACPQCGSPVEFFMRDGIQIAGAVCENCGLTAGGEAKAEKGPPCITQPHV